MGPSVRTAGYLLCRGFALTLLAIGVSHGLAALFLLLDYQAKFALRSGMTAAIHILLAGVLWRNAGTIIAAPKHDNAPALGQLSALKTAAFGMALCAALSYLGTLAALALDNSGWRAERPTVGGIGTLIISLLAIPFLVRFVWRPKRSTAQLIAYPRLEPDEEDVT